MDLNQVISSQKKRFSIYKYIICPRCNGKGGEPNTKIQECPSCRGTGQVQQIKRTFLGTITKYTVCPDCQGEGYIPQKPCNVCKGQGRIKKEEEIEITIPAGVDSEQVLKFRGLGEAGKLGGKPGDLYVRIFIKPHPLFTRRGDDLYTKVLVPFSLMALGGEVEVPTLSKSILLKVPPGTSSGKRFRISNKGIPHFSGYGRGNLYVDLEIKAPKRLTKKQRELLNKLRQEGL
jgi:molecular chaperone DnaJ